MFAKSIAVMLLLACLALVQAAPMFEGRASHRRCIRRPATATSIVDTAPSSTQVNLAAPTPSVPSKEETNKPEENEQEGKDEEEEEKDEPKEEEEPKEPKEDDDEDNEDDSHSDAPAGGAESLQALFPLGHEEGKSWTTCKASGVARTLTDKFLRPQKDMKQLSHDITKAPDGQDAMEAFYPKGSMNPANNPAGGFSFYAPGPDDVDLTSAKEVTFGYSVYFEKGFDWVKGGKLPGVYGGNSDEDATSCSGGRRDDKCFSARLMWRAGGAGEFYNYFPPSFSANKKQCDATPSSDCNSVYGASVGRGAFHFKDGAWTTVAERVKLNDVGKENGEIEMFVNGESVITVKGLVLRGSDQGLFRGMQMQTFFGGSHDGFQASKDSKVWFKDLSLAITKTF